MEALLEEPLLKDTLLASAAQLRYLVLKNLAALLADTADADDARAALAAMRAMQLYGQALLLDDGDAVVWNRMGTLVWSSCTRLCLSVMLLALDLVDRHCCLCLHAA